MTYRQLNMVKAYYCDYPDCNQKAWRRVLEASPYAFWGRLAANLSADFCKDHYFQYYQKMIAFMRKQT